MRLTCERRAQGGGALDGERVGMLEREDLRLFKHAQALLETSGVDAQAVEGSVFMPGA